jgi:hypothetical protein
MNGPFTLRQAQGERLQLYFQSNIHSILIACNGQALTHLAQPWHHLDGLISGVS